MTPDLDRDQCECAAVACSLYADEFSGGERPDVYDDDAWDAGEVYDFTAAEGELLQSACSKLAHRYRGEPAGDLTVAEMVVAAVACDLYAAEFCGDGLAWGETEAEILRSAADELCRTLGVGDKKARPCGEAIRFFAPVSA